MKLTLYFKCRLCGEVFADPNAVESGTTDAQMAEAHEDIGLMMDELITTHKCIDGRHGCAELIGSQLLKGGRH